MLRKPGLLIPLLLALLAACSQAPLPATATELAPAFGTSGADEARALADSAESDEAAGLPVPF